MKKIFAILLSAIMVMAMMTGCVSNNDDSSDSIPDESQNSTPVIDSQDEEPETDYNYETLLSAWKTDYEGYWANAEGAFLHFTFDEEEKAVLVFYGEDGNPTAYALAETLQAIDKSSLMLTIKYPRKGRGEAAGLTQSSKSDSFAIQRAGETDDIDFAYIMITDKDGVDTVYAWAGSEAERVRDAARNAKSLG